MPVQVLTPSLWYEAIRDLSSMCHDMYKSPRWNPTALMIDVKRSVFKKLIKNWLQLFEALVRFIQMVFFGIQHFKIQLFVPISRVTMRNFSATLRLSAIHDSFGFHDHN